MYPEIVATAAKATTNGSSDLRVAVIGALSAVGGALVGGAITGWVTLKAEDKRQDFAKATAEDQRKEEAERDRIALRGAARTWRTRFFEAGAVYRGMREYGNWLPPNTMLLEPPPQQEDRKLIASALEPGQWMELERAEATIKLVDAISATRHEASEDDLPEINDADAKTIRSLLERLDNAFIALSGIAEAPPIKISRELKQTDEPSDERTSDQQQRKPPESREK
jgi:hypothetical protein